MGPSVRAGTVFFDRGAIEYPEYEQVQQPQDLEARWQTPGLYLAERIASYPSVRFVGEKMQPDYNQVIVVADDDSEVLLKQLFSIEREMYGVFSGLRFDCRLRVIPSSNADISAIVRSTLERYRRA